MREGRNHINKIQKENDENVFQQIMLRYVPYWPLFVLSIIVGVGLAYVYVKFKTVPVYEANAKIIIKDEKKGNEESKLLESLDLISSKKIVENEIEIIQSRKIMENVVQSLGLYARIYKKGSVRSELAYTSFPIKVVAQDPDSIPYVEEVSIAFDSKNKMVTLGNQPGYPINQFVKTPYGLLKFEINPHYEPETDQENHTDSSQFFMTLSTPKSVAPSFLGGLKAEASSKLSSIVNLSYRDQSRVRAENILNELIRTYQESANEEKDFLAKNTLDFVNDRLQIAASDLDSIEKEVQKFKSGNQAVDISTQGQLYLQNVSENDQKLGELNTQLAVLDQVESFVKLNKNASGGIVPSTLGINDPLLSQLTEQLYNAELEYNRLRKTVGENNPALVAISDKINTLKPSILSNIRSQRQTLSAARQNIRATNSMYNSMLRSVPHKERELLDISREYQNKRDLYAFLLQKREESEIAAASGVFNSRVIDYALAGKGPVGPKKSLLYIMAAMIFAGLCGIIIFIKEHLTGKILYRSEIEKLTNIPILGEIAFEKSKKGIVIEKGRRSFVAEEFRKLRVSLSFLGIEGKDKNKILVTSSIPGEGKSFTATNLAISLSLTGKRVVLVDMDLNNPTVNRILNVEREKGVTEFLEGEVEIQSIIQHTEEHENLFFISPGIILPDAPTELLTGNKVRSLIHYLEKNFDYVVIDTSPIALVTDGYLLTGLCDATLFVVRHKYTPKVFVKRLEENLRINPIKNPAIIFNGVKAKGILRKRYGYGYGYGYDYAYGGRYRKNQQEKKTEKKEVEVRKKKVSDLEG